MIINKQILSIPPFISTSWKDVELLLSDGSQSLNIYLRNGTLVKIGNLLKDQLDLIFNVHQEVLLQKTKESSLGLLDPFSFSFSTPIMEHDPSLKDLPPLSEDMKQKLSSLIKGLPLPDPSLIEKIEKDCNCPFCQLFSLSKDDSSLDMVTEEDLSFASWEIKEISDQEFLVCHPYNKDEIYEVSLNSPATCSCGQLACEHIEYVLRN